MIPADPEVIRPADVAPTPWANGLGVTRVLLDCDELRISVAEIEGEQPFSTLPGWDRVLIPIQGAGLALTIDGIRRAAPIGEPVVFRGDDIVRAETAGERIRVVNAMARRDAARMTVRVGMPVPDAVAVVVLTGAVVLDGEDLAPGTVVLPAAVGRIRMPGAGLVASILLTLVTQEPSGPSQALAAVECADSGSDGWNMPASTSR